MKAFLWCWPAPSQGHRLCLGCIHTLPAASRSYNRLRQKGRNLYGYTVFPINPPSLPRLLFPSSIHNMLDNEMHLREWRITGAGETQHTLASLATWQSSFQLIMNCWSSIIVRRHVLKPQRHQGWIDWFFLAGNTTFLFMHRNFNPFFYWLLATWQRSHQTGRDSTRNMIQCSYCSDETVILLVWSINANQLQQTDEPRNLNIH